MPRRTEAWLLARAAGGGAQRKPWKDESSAPRHRDAPSCPIAADVGVRWERCLPRGPGLRPRGFHGHAGWHLWTLRVTGAAGVRREQKGQGHSLQAGPHHPDIGSRHQLTGSSWVPPTPGTPRAPPRAHLASRRGPAVSRRLRDAAGPGPGAAAGSDPGCTHTASPTLSPAGPQTCPQAPGRRPVEGSLFSCLVSGGQPGPR